MRLARLVSGKVFENILRADMSDDYQSAVYVLERVLAEGGGGLVGMMAEKKERRGLGCLGQSALTGLANEGGSNNFAPPTSL